MTTDTLRRALLLGGAAWGGLAALGGCASGSTGSADKPQAADAAAPKRRYTETISSVLASQDHRHLVAIGRDHHYVFEAPALLARALQSPLHMQFTAAFTPFHVDKQGDIGGEVTLRLPPGAPAESQRAAADVGLQQQPDGGWAATVRLAGRRYASWTYRRPDQKQEKLGQSYTIEVTTDEGLAEAAVDKAVTPVRIAADGVQLIYYVALAPIIIPFVFLAKARDR
jgi:hypothetical protein